MTQHQINDLRDLWEGCFDFEIAVAMVDADDHAAEAADLAAEYAREGADQ